MRAPALSALRPATDSAPHRFAPAGSAHEHLPGSAREPLLPRSLPRHNPFGPISERRPATALRGPCLPRAPDRFPYAPPPSAREPGAPSSAARLLEWFLSGLWGLHPGVAARLANRRWRAIAEPVRRGLAGSWIQPAR